MRILTIIGIGAVVAVLTVQASWIGAICGLALVGLTKLAAQSPNNPPPNYNASNTIQREVATILDQVPGITAAHPRDFPKSLPIMTLKDGTTVRTWKNSVSFNHVFLADNTGQMIYGGYVGWIHDQRLQKAIAKIRRQFS